ncbi:Retrovirus-related Pol polyprotein from transposon RE1 [Vitis vinifera]|uniref:Retrovirus-related Pol polyprotein from transposon RE1 n=1 Tax=Vitis vinifera TaxID=29760 RepID=A0A438DC37_VITVI|nr:Retrovirus-related Pol polyprotein from transposon RE1 [Vitis vinifera]
MIRCPSRKNFLKALRKKSSHSFDDRVSFWSPFPSPKASDQPYRRQKTLTGRRLFRRSPFPTPTIPSGVQGGDLQLFSKHRRENPGHACLFSGGLKSQSPARQSYEDHLVTQEADIPEVDRVQWRKIDAQLYLETVRDQILGSSSVPSLDDVFARLLRISSTQTLPSDNTSDSSVHTRDRCYQLHGRPPRTAHVAQSSDPQPPQPPSSSTSQGISLTDSEYDDYLRYQATKSASVALLPRLVMLLLSYPHIFSWTLDLDSVTSDHISGPEYGKTIGIGRESQGLYHLTAPSTPAVCISTDAPLSSTVAWATLVYPSSKKWTNFLPEPQNASLGYFRLQKGYHCYSSETHRYFLSADVTFFEDSPFFSTLMPSRPLQVYHRRHRVAVPPSLAEVPADPLPIPSASPAPATPSTDLPIALRKGWRQEMVDEMAALHSNGTWDFVVLPSGKSTVGCRWVYTVKVGPDGQIVSVRLLLSMAAMRSWPLYQLDIKNAFLHGDLVEEVYMEQPPSFVAQGESGLVCRLRRSLYGLKQSPRAWFSRFSSVVQKFGMFRVQQTIPFSIIITLRGSTKDLGKLKYFLGIEIAQSSSGVVLSQRKYALDILEETGMLDCKPVDTPMDPNVKLIPGQGEPLGDPGRYRRLDGKLNYLTITRPDISFPVSVTPGQGVLYENRGHTQVVGYTDVDWAGSPTDRRSTSGYCVFIGGNLISWKSKKQDVVARSSAEAEYRAMALATCKLIWLKHLLQELRFGKDE